MSNKLKKRSKNYDGAQKDLRDLVEKQGGLNITPALMRCYTECEDESKRITEDEFYEIVSKLTEEGFKLFKIVQICKGKEERGMMLCNKETVIAFAKAPEKPVEEVPTETVEAEA